MRTFKTKQKSDCETCLTYSLFSKLLGCDGSFKLQTLSENAGSVIAERVIMELWRGYQGDQAESRWQTEKWATRETTVYSDVMAGVTSWQVLGGKRTHVDPRQRILPER